MSRVLYIPTRTPASSRWSGARCAPPRSGGVNRQLDEERAAHGLKLLSGAEVHPRLPQRGAMAFTSETQIELLDETDGESRAGPGTRAPSPSPSICCWTASPASDPPDGGGAVRVSARCRPPPPEASHRARHAALGPPAGVMPARTLAPSASGLFARGLRGGSLARVALVGIWRDWHRIASMAAG